MVLKSLQAQTLINWFNYMDINQPVQMVAVNYVLSLFEGNKNPRYSMGIKLYLQASKCIYKETDKLDISVSNYKHIIDHFLSLADKYGLGRLAFMVVTATGTNNIFRLV